MHALPLDRPPAGTPLDPGFRNPARVQAMLDRSAVANVQSGPRHAAYRGGRSDPPLVPVTGMAPHAFVAPVLNSSVWAEQEAARLHADAFDEAAALERVRQALAEEEAAVGAPPESQRTLNFAPTDRVFDGLPSADPEPPQRPRVGKQLHPQWARTQRRHRPDVRTLTTLRYHPAVWTCPSTEPCPDAAAAATPTWYMLPLRPFQVDDPVPDAFHRMDDSLTDDWRLVL